MAQALKQHVTCLYLRFQDREGLGCPIAAQSLASSVFGHIVIHTRSLRRLKALTPGALLYHLVVQAEVAQLRRVLSLFRGGQRSGIAEAGRGCLIKRQGGWPFQYPAGQEVTSFH